MTEQQPKDINEILKKKRKVSEKQKNHLIRASYIASQKQKENKMKLQLLNELEDHKLDIHKILEEARQRRSDDQTKEKIIVNEPIITEMTPQENKMEPIKTLKDRLRLALL